MSSLKDLRTRITSVKNTKQLTRAMKMIAAAKLRRVQDKVKECRPFSSEILKMMDAFFSAASDPTTLSPLFRTREFIRETEEGKREANKNLRLFALTSDRGLCGAYNMNVLRTLSGIIKKEQQDGYQVTVDIVGRKGLEYIRRHHPETLGTYFDMLSAEFTRERAVEAMAEYRTKYLKGDFDILRSVYTEFVNTLTQRVKTTTVLPIHPEMMAVEKIGESKKEVKAPEVGTGKGFFIIEPSFNELSSQLVEAFLDSRFYQLLLESVASEYGARMMAMENASKNAGEMIEQLTLLYNRQRQANITTEMLEITGGAEALTNAG